MVFCECSIDFKRNKENKLYKNKEKEVNHFYPDTVKILKRKNEENEILDPNFIVLKVVNSIEEDFYMKETISPLKILTNVNGVDVDLVVVKANRIVAVNVNIFVVLQVHFKGKKIVRSDNSIVQTKTV